MTDIDKLRSAYEKAEADAQKIMAEKDEALSKIRDRYGDKLRAANDDAAAAQKRLGDAVAAQALANRTDMDDAAKQNLATRLGLELPGGN